MRSKNSHTADPTGSLLNFLQIRVVPLVRKKHADLSKALNAWWQSAKKVNQSLSDHITTECNEDCRETDQLAHDTPREA